MHADVRITWWYLRETQVRLMKWTLALLRGRRYSVRLEEEGTGYHDRQNLVIQANPQLFKEEPANTQFRATQGILAHECGHAWFTDAWPDRPGQTVLRWLVNALEDQRVEAAIAIAFPGVAPAIRLAGDLMYARQGALSLPAKEQVLACCLVWRWASLRASEADMFDRLRLSLAAQELWGKVRALVEAAWVSTETSGVIALASQILAILGIPEEEPLPESLRGFGVGDDVEDGREGDALPFPAGPFEGAQPGLGVERAGGSGQGEEEYQFGQDAYSKPAPYMELEDAARPLANRLAEALKLPAPDVRCLPHEWQGRYSFRQELRTPETPHLFPSGVDRAARSLALYVLVDRSGSMNSIDPAVRLGLMTLYLAAARLAIPTGMAYFGSNHPHSAVFEVAPMHVGASEIVKSLIAGYSGATSAEFLAWGLDLALKELSGRPERHKMVLILHDGEPVFRTKTESDWRMSKERLARMERCGMVPIGIYLGSESGCTRLKLLFSRLVVCAGQELPEKLGSLLQSLA